MKRTPWFYTSTPPRKDRPGWYDYKGPGMNRRLYWNGRKWCNSKWSWRYGLSGDQWRGLTERPE